MPVGRVTVVRPGKTFKEIYVVPQGLQNGVEEVLIVVQGEHQSVPEHPESVTPGPLHMMKPPQSTAPVSSLPNALVTDADRLRENYKAVGDAQGHQFGEGGPGSRPPNFNLRVEKPKPIVPPAGATGQTNPSAVPPKPNPVKPQPITGDKTTQPPAADSVKRPAPNVTTNDTTINIVTPPPRKTPPATPAPKPENAEPPPANP
jgi:hypothetical protein